MTRQSVIHPTRKSLRAYAATVSVLASVLGACGGGQVQVQANVPPPPPPPQTVVQQTVVAQPTGCPDAAAYHSIAERAALTLSYNSPSNFGGGALTTGFSPDPWGFHLTAGGGNDGIDVQTLGIRDETTCGACTRSFVTRRPDFHFTFEAGQVFELVRFYVVTDNGADATLLINQPDTTWRCNDDHGRAGWGNPLMPAIDINTPQSGRYDIWVGTFDASRRNPATLYVTEINANHP